MKRTVFGDAMVGFEEWQFPTEFYAIDGDNVLVEVEADPARPARRRQPVRAVGRLDADLRRRRKVPLRGRPPQHGARARGHAREQVPGARRRDAAPAPEPRLLPAARSRLDRATSTLQETIDYVALTRLLSAYADVVNRRAWPEFAELFLPRRAGTRRHRDQPGRRRDRARPSWATFIGGAIERFEFFEFVILNMRIEIDGDDARGARVHVRAAPRTRQRPVHTGVRPVPRHVHAGRRSLVVRPAPVPVARRAAAAAKSSQFPEEEW